MDREYHNRKQREYYQRNKDYYRRWNRNYLKAHPTSNYYAKNKWMESYRAAKARCQNKKRYGYKSYGGRGIKFLLTKEDIKTLWARDAANLTRPTLDRINNDGNYELQNCRFIELSENVRRGYLLRKKKAEQGVRLT